MLGLMESGQSCKNMVGRGGGGKCSKLGETMEGLLLQILLVFQDKDGPFL